MASLYLFGSQMTIFEKKSHFSEKIDGYEKNTSCVVASIDINVAGTDYRCAV